MYFFGVIYLGRPFDNQTGFILLPSYFLKHIYLDLHAIVKEFSSYCDNDEMSVDIA